MSHIAVDLKVIEVHAPAVARTLEEPVAITLGGLNLLWHRCWSTKSATITRIGLAGIFGMDRVDLRIEAMVDAGFLAPEDGGFRVRGAEKYLRIRAGNSKGGKAAAGNLRRGTQPGGKPETKPGTEPGVSREGAGTKPGVLPGSMPALTPSTEHRAPKKESAPTSSTPRESDLLCDDFRQVTGSMYLWQGAKDGTAFARLRERASVDEIRSRWRAGLKAPADAWASCRTVAQLAAKWNDLAPLASQPDTSIPKLRHL